MSSHELRTVADLPESQSGEYNAFFQSTPLTAIPPPAQDHITVIDSCATVREAARSLAAAGILSAPCRDETLPEDAVWSDKYIGIVDAVGLLYWLLKQIEETRPSNLEVALSKTIASTAVRDVLASDPENSRFRPFIPLDPQIHTMLDAMLILGKFACHRLFLVNSPGGDIANVITQSSVVAFLRDNMDAFRPLVSKTIKELGLGAGQKLLSVAPKNTFWEAFELIANESSVSAVPIVDERGHLVGNVSVRDVRGLITHPTSLHMIDRPLNESKDLHFKPFTVELVSCVESDTLESVINKLASSRVHRVYLCDKDFKAVGVISLRDVIALFVKEPSQDYMGDYFVEKVAMN